MVNGPDPMPESYFSTMLKNFQTIRDLVSSAYESFIQPNNDSEIQFLKYPVPGGLKAPKYASHVGHGFSRRSDVEFFRSFFNQTGAKLDFLRKSISTDDPFYKPFLPNGTKYECIAKVAKHWYEDEFFANELFNGCNPYTVKKINYT
jgi:hypothetical protein